VLLTWGSLEFDCKGGIEPTTGYVCVANVLRLCCNCAAHVEFDCKGGIEPTTGYIECVIVYRMCSFIRRMCSLEGN
jgi:hypothetical protein